MAKKQGNARGKAAPKGTPTRGRAHARAEAERSARRSRLAVYGVVAGGVAIVVGIIVLSVVLADSGESGVSEVEAGEAASFDLPALDGEEGERVRLADFAGTPVVVNFFASWCTTCDAELPEFDRMADELEGQVEFVFVNANEDADWRPMAERNDILDQTLAKDLGADNNELYTDVGGTIGMPITAFFDENGELVKTVFQGLTFDLLNTELQENFGISAQAA